eukprot:GHVT01073831.1.p1 GENE.GHVT01073831.1~~GHVT01073831.1.p1  ORF type:complete len:225 (+),score=33.27 GHVT01073831.1:129-803(+)
MSHGRYADGCASSSPRSAPPTAPREGLQPAERGRGAPGKKPSAGLKPTLVYYHIPGDFDDCRHPNSFPILKKIDAIKLKDVKKKFPLPGIYHWRFKMRVDASSFVWMDVTNDDALLPSYNRKVIAKVLRLGWQPGPPLPPAPPASPPTTSPVAGAATHHPHSRGAQVPSPGASTAGVPPIAYGPSATDDMLLLDDVHQHRLRQSTNSQQLDTKKETCELDLMFG